MKSCHRFPRLKVESTVQPNSTFLQSAALKTPAWPSTSNNQETKRKPLALEQHALCVHESADTEGRGRTDRGKF